MHIKGLKINFKIFSVKIIAYKKKKWFGVNLLFIILIYQIIQEIELLKKTRTKVIHKNISHGFKILSF